jgi:uncharacterized Zn-binding protein involved in type VI secretion
MGMPACTITSQTAHGGVVIVGFPTVLINFMPASRIGDMHVCPMVTGIVPHVGGPFVLGSPTVLVGFMPQSRVTDQLVCVGPPDVAVMGAETVLVGMAGAGGAAGAAGGIGAMGASVPMQAPPASSTQAALQSDGTVATQAAPGSSLPPVALSQPGFPDLPPEATATFQSIQPVTLPQGTQLFAASDADSDGTPSFWSTSPPEITNQAKDVVKVLTVTDPAGLKAWAGEAASPAAQTVSQEQQLAQQAVSQNQQSLAQATQQAQQGQQVWTSAASTASQALQKFAMPKKG